MPAAAYGGSPMEKTDDITTATRQTARRPWGLQWRSSIWFITLAVGLGIFVDILIYSLIVPVIPFRLQDLGYDGVSGLVGWLLFAYSAAIVVATPPIAHLTELHKNRRVPLLLGQGALIASQVVLMEAPKFWVMVIARVAQGVSASVIWVVGLALVCDTVPETIVGKQMGLVMMGASFGFLVGPPVAGALNSRFGFRGPFIFGIAVTLLELMCRVLIIERKEAVRWDASLARLVPSRTGSPTSRGRAYGAVTEEKREEVPVAAVSEARADEETGTAPRANPSRESTVVTPAGESQRPAQLSILRLLLMLLKSKRAMTPVFLALLYGLILTSQEPVLPLYLEAIYGLDTAKIGLVYIAAIVPSFISSPLSGWYADKEGPLGSTILCIVGAIPFFFLLFLKVSLPVFLVFFGFMNFFFYGLVSPIMAEMAAVTTSLPGIGYGHMYGAFNIAYGLGSALGPVIGGQIYDHLSDREGWMIVNIFDAGITVVGLLLTLCFFGERPAVQRILAWLRNRSRAESAGESGTTSAEVA